MLDKSISLSPRTAAAAPSRVARKSASPRTRNGAGGLAPAWLVTRRNQFPVKKGRGNKVGMTRPFSPMVGRIHVCKAVFSVTVQGS